MLSFQLTLYSLPDTLTILKMRSGEDVFWPRDFVGGGCCHNVVVVAVVVAINNVVGVVVVAVVAVVVVLVVVSWWEGVIHSV